MQENGNPLICLILQYYYFNNRLFSTINVNSNVNMPWDSIYNFNELCDILKKFDYIYPYNVGKNFYDRYGYMFGIDLENREHLYKIVDTGSEIDFKTVE